ncbi:MAG: sulfite exporter TauE/SafE family protein [Methylococcaceae bacterium]|nr:sulfite exporter TauE/SafE family protein [Methylococcaceae bacterium]
MIFGSFIAGATSEGGGAIAFPIFTKVLHILPFDAKVFSLAIQSIGMLAASLTIIVMRVTVEWRFILWASLGGIFGVTAGSLLITPLLSSALIKMLFTAMVSSFALTLLLINWRPRVYNKYMPMMTHSEKQIVLVTGFFGGIMTGLVGTGIDIICFSVMVLLFRLPEKISTPSSVILMAINAWVGFALHVFVLDGFTDIVKDYWLAAIPVVVVGAPLGAFFCTRLNNRTIASIVIGLILVELISSLYLIPLTREIISISSLVFVLFLFIYYRISVSKRYSFDLKKGVC